MRNFKFINYDDHVYVSENKQILTGLKWNNIKWVLTSEHGSNWHPLTGLSHMLDCQLFGPNPGWHHLVNLMFHMANTLLLFTILGRITGAFWQSAFVAALFALHPLHVESVAWVSERKDVLSTFFCLLTMKAYFRYVERSIAGQYVLALMFFSLGLASKPMLVTLPLVLLLLDYWPLNRMKTTGEVRFSHLVLEKIPFFFLSAVSSIITLFVQTSSGALRTVEKLTLTARFANAVVSYVKYIGKMIWPLNLAPFYPYSRQHLPAWQAFVSIALLLTVTILVIRLSKKYSYLFVGWFWYLIMLVPVIGLVQVGDQAMADRYTYIPLTGLFIILAWGTNDLLQNWKYRKIALGISFAAVIPVLSVLTWCQASYWQNSEKLFRHTLKATGENYLAYINLGVALMEQNKVIEAIDAYRKAIVINPDKQEPYYNLAVAYNKIGRGEEAAMVVKEAIRLKPDNARAWNTLGAAYSMTGRLRDAAGAYKRAIEIDTHYADAYNNLSMVCVQLGHFREALDASKQAIELQPDFSKAYSTLGTVYHQLGMFHEAIDAYKKAVKIDPDYVNGHYNLGLTYLEVNDSKSAMEEYELLQKLDMGKANELFEAINKKGTSN